MQRDPPVGQPGHVAGQRSPSRRQPDRVEQFGADAARLEVDQRGGAHVEGEAPVAEVARAAAGVPVRLEDDGGQPGRLQPQRGGHAGHPAAEHRHIEVLNARSEHVFNLEDGSRLH